MEEKLFSQDYLDALLSGQRSKASQVIGTYMSADGSVLGAYEGIMKPALYEVGALWEQNKISVAAEHLATAITEGILNELYEKLISGFQSEVKRKVVVACVENELHQVGIVSLQTFRTVS